MALAIETQAQVVPPDFLLPTIEEYGANQPEFFEPPCAVSYPVSLLLDTARLHYRFMLENSDTLPHLAMLDCGELAGTAHAAAFADDNLNFDYWYKVECFAKAAFHAISNALYAKTI